MTLVKICGICDAAGAAAVALAGADMVGFHFCASPRRVEPERAREMIEALPRRVTVVGVFLDQEPAEVDQIAGYCDLDLVQLHGSEAPGYPSARPLLKALKVRGEIVPDATGWPDPILLDSWSRDQRGGTGRAWNWDLARPLLATRRVILAGGLEPGNVAAVVRRHRPYGVDVSSGVESGVRRKDPDKVRAFVQAVREQTRLGGGPIAVSMPGSGLPGLPPPLAP